MRAGPNLRAWPSWKMVCTQIVCAYIIYKKKVATMWVHEYVRETGVGPEAIWAVLSDLDQWPSWDTSMERVALQGPFAVGSQVSMTPQGQDPIVSTIIAISPAEYYA